MRKKRTVEGRGREGRRPRGFFLPFPPFFCPLSISSPSKTRSLGSGGGATVASSSSFLGCEARSRVVGLSNPPTPTPTPLLSSTFLPLTLSAPPPPSPFFPCEVAVAAMSHRARILIKLISVRRKGERRAVLRRAAAEGKPVMIWERGRRGVRT